MTTAPYGTWPSPVTTELVTSGTASLASPQLDGDTLYWLESRPDQGGRVDLLRQPLDGTTEAVTSAPFNVRSRVHEYGGGAYAVRDGIVVFSDFADNRLYRVRDGRTTPLTPESDHRYADLRVHPDRDLVLAVREDHSGDGEPVTTIVGLELGGEGVGTVLCSGADFYSDPELSDTGVLAWTEWNHPAMPWDATLIRRGRLVDGAVVDVVDVAGGANESAVHPRWAPGGELIFVSDRTDWWNLYADRDGVTTPLWPDTAEFATPQWVFGEQPYVVLDSSRLLVSRIAAGVISIELLDRSSQTLRPVLASGLSGPLTAAGGRAAALIEDPDRPARLGDRGPDHRELDRCPARRRADPVVGLGLGPAGGQLVEHPRRRPGRGPRLVLPADQPGPHRTGGRAAAADHHLPRWSDVVLRDRLLGVAAVLDLTRVRHPRRQLPRIDGLRSALPGRFARRLGHGRRRRTARVGPLRWPIRGWPTRPG